MTTVEPSIDSPRQATFVASGAILAALGVALGAFGAHALEGVLSPDRFETYQTAVQYQLIHAIGLVLVGTAGLDRRWTHFAGRLFLGGIVLFSGSLYLLVATDTAWLGAVTPLGGVSFIAGWLCLAVAGFSADRK